MGRTLSPTQDNGTVVLAVRDRGVWSKIRQIAIQRGLPLPTIVEEALNILIDQENVRAANS